MQSADPSSAARGSGPEHGWFHNPVTGEVARLLVGPDETGGRRIETDLWLQPGAAVVGAHTHDRLTERFEVLQGEVTFRLDSSERAVRPGDGQAEVRPGTVHDWWNTSEGVSRVRVEVEAADGSEGQPARRFVEMIEVLWSLAALGKVNAKGLPDPLWLAAIATEYRDVMQLTKPPPAVQGVVFGPLAAIARRRGRDPLAAELHGEEAPLRIPDPGAGLDDLLRAHVGARRARNRG